jgi:hypothetical protein
VHNQDGLMFSTGCVYRIIAKQRRAQYATPKNRKLAFGDYFDQEARMDIYLETTLEQVYPLPKGGNLYYH